MNKKLLLTTTIMTALFLGTMNANAACPVQEKGMMPPHPPLNAKIQKEFTPEQKAEMEKRKAEMDKRLNITAEQKAQLKAIHEKSKAEIAPKIKQLTEVEHELMVIEQKEFNQKEFGITSLENVQLSGKTTTELRNEQKKLRHEIHEIKKANFEASQNVFTEEQKQELQKMHKEKMEKMKKMNKDKKSFGPKPPMPPKEF